MITAPKTNNTPDVHGRAAERSIVLRTIAPTNAARPPGTAILIIVGQSTFPNLMWEIPEKAVVPTSAKCTTADAAAGL
jgi:hypothetical protein